MLIQAFPSFPSTIFSSTPRIIACFCPEYYLDRTSSIRASPPQKRFQPPLPKEWAYPTTLIHPPLNRCIGNHPALSLPPLPYEWNHPTTYLTSTPTSTPLWVDPYPCTSTFKPLYKALPSPFTYLMSTPTSTPLWVDPYPCTSIFKPLYKALPSPITPTLHIATSPNYILFHPYVPAMLIPYAIDINTPTQ